jgi:hypothetical protein
MFSFQTPQENGIGDHALQQNGVNIPIQPPSFTNTAVETVAAVTNAVNSSPTRGENSISTIGSWLFNRNVPQTHGNAGKASQISTTQAIEKSLTRNLTQREQREYFMFG